MDGLSAFKSSFSSSPQMRSFGKSVKSIERQISTVSASISKSNRAANCAARNTRRQSSAKVSSRDDTQNFVFDVCLSVKRINNFAGQRILHHCVDCKIASFRRFRKRHLQDRLRRQNLCVRVPFFVRGAAARHPNHYRFCKP